MLTCRTLRVLPLVATLVCVVASPAIAATVEELLEKGIYEEETVGNLDEAIQIYRKVVQDAAQTERVAANAQFRLAQCLLKQEKKEEAKEAFRQLVKKYPAQQELVAKANTFLSTGLELNTAPWKTGERTTLAMSLPNGQTIGLIGTHVEEAEVNGQACWKMLIRRFVSDGQNEGVSRVVVNQETNRPLETQFQHVLLGNTNATWSDDEIKMTTIDKSGRAEQKRATLDQAAYSNDQWFFSFRQLPLTLGYKTTIPIRVAFSGGTPIGLEVEVTKKEMIETPVGSFECFRLDTNIQQTFWIADVPQRYLVRFQGGGVDAILTSVSDAKSKETVADDDLGVSFDVPAGWYYHNLTNPSEKGDFLYRIVAPDMASVTLSIKAKSKLKEAYRESLKAWAQSKLDKGNETYKNFELRDEGMVDTTCAGAPAIEMTVDQDLAGAKVVRTVVMALAKEKSVAMSATIRADLYDAMLPIVKTIQESITVE